MKENTHKIVSLVALVLAVILSVVSVGSYLSKTDESAGGLVYYGVRDFKDGIKVNGTTVIDGSGNWKGALAGTTGTFSSTLGVTGAATLSSTLGVSATSTLTGNVDMNGTFNSLGDAATSTAQVGKANNAGCLILGDSAGGASVVYITATGSTVSATTTKPAACSTAR